MNPAIGFRVWGIDEMLTRPRLVSPFRYSPWRPRTALQAECKVEPSDGKLAKAHRQEPNAPPPVEACSCGIYAYHDAERMVNGMTAGTVGGAVVCWGRLTIHPEGLRAQFARPLALCMPEIYNQSTLTALIRLGASYGIPLLEVSHIALYASEFGECYRPVPDPSSAFGSRVGKSMRDLFGRWFNV